METYPLSLVLLDFVPTIAFLIGAYYLVRDVIVSIAALSSAILWNISPATNFTVAAVCGALGTILFALHRPAERTGI